VTSEALLLRVRLVAEQCDVSAEEILAPSCSPKARSASSVRARRWAMLLCHIDGWSYPEIGRAFGRDHSTCLVAVRKAKKEHPELVT
jgi:chromosomal replication initiation ATPase DnaA